MFEDIDFEETSAKESEKPNRALQLYLMFLLSWQKLFRISTVGMNVLFKFIALFLVTIANLMGMQTLQTFASTLPKSVTAAQRLIGRKESFYKWVCCQKCSSLYSIEDAKMVSSGTLTSKLCSHVRYPNHPQPQHRKSCGCLLLKTVRTSGGSTTLYPKALYCYQSLIHSLESMLQHPNFITKCESWRFRNTSNVLRDVYDGQIWKDFMNYNGQPFLALPYNFMLSLNVDWFEPFKRTTHSTGVMYMCIQNLPRNERFLSENVILIGVIPGPREPKLTINSFLEPLVKELQHLWKGVVMKNAAGASVIVRAALTCVACDIPAARKVCGFVGHNARLACSKCLKVFETEVFGDKPDFSGFDKSLWVQRHNSAHRQYAFEHKSCNTLTDQKRIERDHGCRYSVLLELSYFDPIRMCIIDPMHNLLLGSAKHVLSVWTELNLVTSNHLKTIQDHVDCFVTPSDTGRIPGKIASGFSGFTAEQYRNWTLIFSLSALKDILPHQHFDCWHYFVKACYLVCRREISVEEVEEADGYLDLFCKKFEVLYSKKYCTINLHLHGHLKSCILDHGPVYSFWLFAFERLNGIMESFHTNGHDVSLQLMRRFIELHSLGVESWPEEFKQDFAPLLEGHKYNKGSLMQSSLETNVKAHCESDPRIQPLPPVFECAFESLILDSLKQTIIQAKFISHGDFTILSLVSKCSALKIGDYVLGSEKSRHSTSSVVMVCHDVEDETKIKLANIEFFFRCNVRVRSESVVSFWFVAVKLYSDHLCKVWFGSPTEVWSAVTTPGMYFLPLTCIKCRVAYCKKTVNFGRVIGNDSVIIAVPLSSGAFHC